MLRQGGNGSIQHTRYYTMTKKAKKGSILIDRELCKGCYLCISVCPNHLIGVSDTLNHTGYYPAEVKNKQGDSEGSTCTGCAMCALICPDVAIEVYRD